MAATDRTVALESMEIICSVCIANYNGRDIIDDCIGSVLAQQCGFSYEIIVHDDASPDRSADDIAARYPQVTLIRSQQNVGYCISNNRMAERARGQFLLLLNNDATLEPDALQTLYNEAVRQTVPTVFTLPQYNAGTGELVDRGLLLDPFLNPVPNLNSARRDVATVHGACLWVPIKIWNEIGGFPEWFQMVAEDLYLCCVTRLWGGAVRVTTHSGYYHRIGYSLGGGKVHESRLATTFHRRALSERNKNFVMLLCYPLSVLWLVMPLHAILLLTEGTIFTLLKHNATIFPRIYLAALTSLWGKKLILSSCRHALQAKRTVGTYRFFSTFTWLPHKLLLLMRYGLPQIRERS